MSRDAQTPSVLIVKAPPVVRGILLELIIGYPRILTVVFDECVHTLEVLLSGFVILVFFWMFAWDIILIGS